MTRATNEDKRKVDDRTGFHEVAVKRLFFIGKYLRDDQVVLSSVAFKQRVSNSVGSVIKLIGGLDPAVFPDNDAEH